MTETHSRAMLGAFIRAHRERQAPPAVSANRRRTPGLRREELADAAGVGVTWITWLEQGRDVAASAAALARLADALKLSAPERASLFELAGRRDPAARSQVHNDIAPQLLALPSYCTVPAYLLDHTWTARAWNASAARLFAGWLDSGDEHNLLKFVFLKPAAQRLIVNWPERARRLVAEFRADYSRRPGDAPMQELIATLSENSAQFATLWREQAVLDREGGEREFQHPVDGSLHFLQTTLLVASQQECKLVCLTPQSSMLCG
jgi:transcriptional regulator with XRE-family HTH domain